MTQREGTGDTFPWPALAPEGNLTVVDLRGVGAAPGQRPESAVPVATATEPAVLVLADRRCLRTLLRGWRRPRRWLRLPTIAGVRARLDAYGFEVADVFLAWPDAGRPNVVSPVCAAGPRRWAQRTGVLGGGGSRYALACLMRSAVFTPFVRPFTAGLVVVGRREAPG